jgi:hypothetical protein
LTPYGSRDTLRREVEAMNERLLASLPFELVYLAFLTKNGLKRLSRWEAPLKLEERRALSGLGLHVAEAGRRTLLGSHTKETVFSARPEPVGIYLSRFGGRRHSSSEGDIRLQGFLFGYPSCCVEEFIRQPYSKNGLSREDQRILFHWACPDCRVTPGLLRGYRPVYRACSGLFGEKEPLPAQVGRKAGITTSRVMAALQPWTLPAAVCLSALLIGPRVAAASDPHLLPVAGDQDSDFLFFEEEVLSGLDWYNPSTAPDTLLDGVAVAIQVKALIDALPESAQPDMPYKVFEYQYGVETCEICGEVVNMGCIRICHPLRGLSVEVPFVAYHYLEHGSLSYLGSVHEGRLDLSVLKRILLCAGDGHQTFYDGDLDGLDFREEAFIGTVDGNPDTDGDSVKDGPQYFESLVASLSHISREVSETQPYMIEMQMNGVETCDICGNTYNMGFVQLVNPLEGLTADLPYVALHYLAHGSVRYAGSENVGVLLPTIVNTVLNGDGTAHWREIAGDSDGDGLTDAEEAHFSLDPQDPDSDNDGVPDGPALARAMHAIIESLPHGETPDSVYRIEHWARGVHTCLVCGEVVNMGIIEIVNPSSGESVLLPYIDLHFMEHGSFANDRMGEVERADPCAIDQVLGSPAYVPLTPVVPQVLQVYPNPFARWTRIVCDIPRAGALKVTIHDPAGRQVMEFLPVRQVHHEIIWDGTDRAGRRLAPGAYFVRLDIEGTTLSRKVLLFQ